jgi:nucleoside-diphosphate-sugar epimerase
VPDGRCFLVTGCTGFLGRHLVRNLAESGPVRLRLVAPGGVVADLPAAARPVSEFVAQDAADPMNLAGVDAVLHLLQPRTGGPREPFDRHGVDATLALALHAAEAGVRRFVLVSSTAVGDPPLGRPGPQALTMRLAEEGLGELAARSRLELIILRPCLMAGEGQAGGALLTLFRLCRRGLLPVFGRLDAPRAIVDVEDVARAILRAIDHGAPGSVYPLTSGVHHELSEILAVVGGLVGNPRPYLRLPATPVREALNAIDGLLGHLGRRPPWSDDLLGLLLGGRVSAIDSSRRELGYAPHFRDLRAMLARTYAWFGMSGQL